MSHIEEIKTLDEPTQNKTPNVATTVSDQLKILEQAFNKANSELEQANGDEQKKRQEHELAKDACLEKTQQLLKAQASLLLSQRTILQQQNATLQNEKNELLRKLKS